jgi:diguanylate cyclase (GGDEF)-like protein
MTAVVTPRESHGASGLFLRALQRTNDEAALGGLAHAAAHALGARGVVLEVAEGGRRFTAPWPSRQPLAGRPTASFAFPGGRLRVTWRVGTAPRAADSRAALEALALAVAGWKRARRRAARDPLTGLPNRWAMRDGLERRWQEAERYHAALAVAVVDVNGLKSWNERYGHIAGDRALQRLARWLRRGCRGADLVARWGGDEFVILMPRTDRAGAETLARRLAAECPPPGISVGVADRAEIVRGGASALLRRADARLRAAKKRRRHHPDPIRRKSAPRRPLRRQ